MRRNAQKTAPFARLEAKVWNKFVFFLLLFGFCFHLLSEYIMYDFLLVQISSTSLLFFKIQLKWKFIQLIFSLFLRFSISLSLAHAPYFMRIRTHFPVSKQKRRWHGNSKSWLCFGCNRSIPGWWRTNWSWSNRNRYTTSVQNTFPLSSLSFVRGEWKFSLNFLPISRFQSKRFTFNETSFFPLQSRSQKTNKH